MLEGKVASARDKLAWDAGPAYLIDPYGPACALPPEFKVSYTG